MACDEFDHECALPPGALFLVTTGALMNRLLSDSALVCDKMRPALRTSCMDG